MLHRMVDGHVESHDLGERIGCAVLTNDPMVLLIALQSGLYRYHLQAHTRELLEGTAVNAEGLRFNDGKVDPRGRFWVGSMEVDVTDALGVLYRLDANGLTPLRDGLGISNGLAWRSDLKRMYHIDSKRKQIAEYEYDAESGELGETLRAIDTSAHEGLPDGMCIDADDRLWVAFWGGSRVRCFDPATDQWLHEIVFPASQVSSCAFCGESLDTLLVTTAGIGKRGEEPLAGRLFKAKVPAKGLPPVRWGGI